MPKASRIGPYQYLRDVFKAPLQAKTLEDYEQLLPSNWFMTAGTVAILKKTAA